MATASVLAAMVSMPYFWLSILAQTTASAIVSNWLDFALRMLISTSPFSKTKNLSPSLCAIKGRVGLVAALCPRLPLALGLPAHALAAAAISSFLFFLADRKS